MPKIVDPAAKRREIVAAAISVFTRHGARGTSLARVAAAAGMGKSSLYHYFPSREALLAAIAERMLSDEADLLREIAERPLPPERRLDELVRTLALLLEEWVRGRALMLDFLGDPRGRRRFRATVRAAKEAVARIVRDGQAGGSFRRGPPEPLATFVIACLDGLFLLEVLDPGSTGGRATLRLIPDLLRAALARPRRTP